MGHNVTHNLTMAVNINALSGTYIGDQSVQSCDPAAFQIVPVTMKPYDFPSTNNVSIPVFELTSVSGIAQQSFAIYFMMDLNSDNTVVWDQSCVYEPTGLSCKQAPVTVQSVFNSTASYQQAYTDYETSGYLVSGNVSASTICKNDNCKIIEIYSATTMSQDNWLQNVATNQYLSYGVLGYGLNSPFWNQYIDQATGSLQFSIQLTEDLSQSLSQSEIILGGFNSGFEGQTNLIITNNATNPFYELTQFAFGSLLTTQCGQVDAAYFQSMTTAPVQLSISFKGMGLPNPIYNEFNLLLSNATNN